MSPAAQVISRSIHHRHRATVDPKPVGNLAVVFTSNTAISASLPGSIVPFRSATRSAHAPLMVAAAMASAGDIFICVHASDIAIGILRVGDVPGL